MTKDTNVTKENYLKSIYKITKEKGYCRSIDLAEELNVTKPSVSYAVKRLENDGYVIMDEQEDKHLILTEAGEKIAEEIYQNHEFFYDLLIRAGVDEKVARDEAHRLEHGISQDSLKKLEAYGKKMNVV